MTPFLTLVLAAALSSRDVNYIVVDVRTKAVLKQDWPDADQPIPVGSLVKPFTALASSGPFPKFFCKGAVDHCWLAAGHGSLGIREAFGALLQFIFPTTGARSGREFACGGRCKIRNSAADGGDSGGTNRAWQGLANLSAGVDAGVLRTCFAIGRAAGLRRFFQG